MRFASFFIAVSLAQSALGAVLPIGDDKRALAFGNGDGPVELVSLKRTPHLCLRLTYEFDCRRELHFIVGETNTALMS